MFTKQDLRRLILPLIIEQILLVAVGMADTIMISSVGEAAVSGVSLVGMARTRDKHPAHGETVCGK